MKLKHCGVIYKQRKQVQTKASFITTGQKVRQCFPEDMYSPAAAFLTHTSHSDL